MEITMDGNGNGKRILQVSTAIKHQCQLEI